MAPAKEQLRDWIDNSLSAYKQPNGTYSFTKAHLLEMLLACPEPIGTASTFVNPEIVQVVLNFRDRQDFNYTQIAKHISMQYPQLLITEVSELTGVLLVTRAREIKSK